VGAGEPLPSHRRKLGRRLFGILATRILLQAGFPAVNIGGGYKTYQLFCP